MLPTIRRLRSSAARALAAALRAVPDDADECQLRDAWHERLLDDRTFPEGWYTPPPHGLVVAIGDPPTFDRVNLPSYRAAEAWPSSSYRLGPESVLFAYASPVDRASGLVGDMACSVYRGTTPRSSRTCDGSGTSR